MLQVLLESVVLTSFMVVSGMVVAELVSPMFGDLLGVSLVTESMTIGKQILTLVIIVIPVGILSVILPIQSFINHVKDNITHLSHRIY